MGRSRSLGVPDIEDPAGHACGQVTAGGTEDHDLPARHVLTAVVAASLHDGYGAAVAHRKALAHRPRHENTAAGGAVENGVARPVPAAVGGGAAREDGNGPSTHALAHSIVGRALELDLDARD